MPKRANFSISSPALKTERNLFVPRARKININFRRRDTVSGIVVAFPERRVVSCRVSVALELHDKFGEMSVAVILQTINSVFWDSSVLH